MEVHVGVEWWLTVLGVGVSERRAKVDRVAPAKPTTTTNNRRQNDRICRTCIKDKEVMTVYTG